LEGCDVLCGGNDAVLAAFSGGFTKPGDINYICGTCEITNVCVDHPVSSPTFNLRCHVIPNRWVTFFVLNTGGLALDWFYSVFCKEMTREHFYTYYVPSVLESLLQDPNPDQLEAQIPEYVPFLQGCRYSLEQLKASFSGLTLETTREHILLGLIRGNASPGTTSRVGVGYIAGSDHGGGKIMKFLRQSADGADFEFEYIPVALQVLPCSASSISRKDASPRHFCLNYFTGSQENPKRPALAATSSLPSRMPGAGED
jgi:hypothetical protein